MNYIDQEQNLEKTIKSLAPEVGAMFLERNISGVIGEIAGEFDLTYRTIGWICELVRRLITNELGAENFENELKSKLEDDKIEIIGNILTELNDKVLTKILPVLNIQPIVITAPVVAISKEPETVIPETEEPVVETAENVQKTEPELPSMAINDSGIEFNEQEKNKNQSEEETAEAVAENLERSVPIRKVIPEKPKEPSEIKPSYVSNTKDYGFENFQSNKLAPVPPQPLSEFSTSKVYKPPANTNGVNEQNDTRSNFSHPPIVEMNSERMSENPLGSFLKMLSSKLTEKELQTRFDKLPYTLKNALRSVDSAKMVLDIGRKYALHVDKLGELGEETGMVILGMTQPAQFLPRLSRRLGISEEKTKLLAQEINNEVFLKIREALKQVNGEVPSSYTSNTMKTRLSPLQPTEVETPKKADESLPNREAILKDIENPNSSVSEDTEKFTAKDWFNKDSNGSALTDIEPKGTSKPVAPTAPKFIKPPVAPVKNSVPPIPPVPPSQVPPRPLPPRPPMNKVTPPVAPMPPKNVEQIPVPPKPPTAPVKTFAPAPEIKIPNPPVAPKMPQNQPAPKIVIAPATRNTQQSTSSPAIPTNNDYSREVPKIVIGQRPQSNPVPATKNIIDQKLSTPVQSTKTETKYSSDPYREPIA